MRVALGARRGAVLRVVFVRAASQVGLGVVLGIGAYCGYTVLTVGTPPVDGVRMGSMVLTVALLSLTAFLATWGAARRGLSIQPAEVMKSD